MIFLEKNDFFENEKNENFWGKMKKMRKKRRKFFSPFWAKDEILEGYCIFRGFLKWNHRQI